MSNATNEMVKENILDEVMAMTIEEFQNAIDEKKIAGNTIVDEMVENLVMEIFQEKAIQGLTFLSILLVYKYSDSQQREVLL